MDFDAELLETAVYRKDALAALAEEPHHRRDLQETLDLSKTTCHRILRTFNETNIARRTDAGYELTPFGHIVAEQVTRYAEQVKKAHRLRPLLDLFEASDEDFDYSVFADAQVHWTVEQGQSFTIDRGVELVTETDVLRVLDWTPVPDLYHEKILQILADNQASVESVYPQSEVKDRLERFPDLHEELLENGANARYWVYDDVPPWGMSIYDDSLVELRAYDQQSGAYILDATTETASAVEWALDIFAEYRDRADPVTTVDDLPDWGDYSW